MAQLASCGPVLVYCGVGPLGQVPNFLGLTRSYQPVFLGVCVQAPEIVFTPYLRTLKSDSEGDEADDVQFCGEEADVYAELNWYNENVYAAIASQPDFAVSRGSTRQRDMGRLLKRARLMYPLWLAFPYAGKILIGGLGASSVAGTEPQRGGAFLAGGLGRVQGGFAQFAAGPPQAPTGPPGPRIATEPGVGFQAGLQPEGLTIGQERSVMPRGYRFPQAYLFVDTLPALGTKARRIVLQWHCIREPRYNAAARQIRKVRKLYDHDMSGLPSPK